MAAYGCLVSLMNTINDIQDHPRPPISFDENQIESLTKMANFFKDFLRTYNPHPIYAEEANPLEARIAEAAYAAEDAIDLSITNHSFEEARLALYEDLQRVIHEMGSIKKEALEITQREGVQHPQMLQSQSRSMTKSSTSSGSSSVQQNTTMVGIEKVTNEFLEKIIGENTCRQVIPVTGMGGIGKTTLATNVYQHKTVVHHFDLCAWATISQDFRMKETLLKLVQDNLSGMNEDDLGVKLHQKLIGRRYLIVLDDIWDIEVWEKLQLYFPDNDNGSRIVLTTRQLKLAHDVCGSEYPYLGIKMRFLDEDASWGLFCKVVFEREDFPPALEEMERLGRKIVASCKGLPLSINVIGGLLKASARTPQYWEYVTENLNSIVNSEDNEHCLKILYTSYNSLPVYLKPCFMYMGVFEEDIEIRVYHLIRLLVAEGFVEAESGKSLEEVAEEWVIELVDRNLILVGKLGSLGKLESCKVHDLLRDFCLREARKHIYLNIEDASTSIYNVEDPATRALIEDLRIPRALSVWGSLVDSSKIWSVCPLFRKRLRRVYSIKFLTDFVYEKMNFRFVEAKRPYPDESFFPFISSCWNLQTLLVHDTLEVPILRIWNLSQLRHVGFLTPLVLSNPLDDDFVLKNLQTLLRVKNMKFSEGVIKRLPIIKELEVVYDGDKRGVSEYCLNNVCNLHKLSSLSLHTQKNGPLSEIKKLTFPNSLKELSLSGTELQWIDMTQKLGSLPLLQVLILRKGACVGPEWHTVEGQFVSLKILDIYLCNLEYWETDNSHFPCLEQLYLTGLSKLKEVPSCIGDISTLRSITLYLKCSYSAYDSARRIQEEQESEGNYDLEFQIYDMNKGDSELEIAIALEEIERQEQRENMMRAPEERKEHWEKVKTMMTELFSQMNCSVM